MESEEDSRLTSFEPFMPGFVFLDMLLDPSFEHAVIFFQAHRRRPDDKRFGEFTSSIVRYRDDGCVANSRMRQKMSF